MLQVLVTLAHENRSASSHALLALPCTPHNSRGAIQRIRSASVIASVLSLWFLSAGFSSAAPDQDNPADALPVRPEAENQRIQAEALKQYQAAAAAAEKFQESSSEGKLERVKPQEITAAYEAALRLQELAQQLQDMGESAGVDFGQRARRLTEQFDQLIVNYRKLPAMAAKIDKSYSIVSREVQQKMSAIPQAEKLTKAEKHTEAAEVILEATYRIRSMTAWFAGKKRALALGGLTVPLRTHLEVGHKHRSAQAKEAMQAVRTQLTPDFETLRNDLQSAIESLQSTGKVQIDGKSLTGPEVLQQFSRRWQEAQHATLRCRSLDWASGLVPPSPGSQALVQLLAEQKKFSEDVVPLMAKVIAADALKIPPGEVNRRYVDYLDALAPLVSLSDDRVIPSAWTEALDTLADKSAPFAEEARSYRSAMSELLRWRARQADALAKSRTGKAPTLDRALFEAVVADNETPGLVPSNAPNALGLAIGTSLPDAMKVASVRLLNQKVIVSKLEGFPNRGNLVVSRIQSRNYAWFRRVEGWDAQVKALEEDLLVNQAAPALSLEAAVALHSAKRGSAAAAQGTISGMALESLVTRMATLSEKDRALVPLGALAPEPVDNTPLSHLLMRVKLTPSWVQHRYFFVRVE